MIFTMLFRTFVCCLFATSASVRAGEIITKSSVPKYEPIFPKVSDTWQDISSKPKCRSAIFTYKNMTLVHIDDPKHGGMTTYFRSQEDRNSISKLMMGHDRNMIKIDDDFPDPTDDIKDTKQRENIERAGFQSLKKALEKARSEGKFDCPMS